MKIKLTLLLTALTFSLFANEYTPVSELNTRAALKAEILKIATDNKGKPDQDLRIQKTLDPYVEKLLKVAPQAAIKDRIKTLAGRWQQVWGPYEYRKYDRSIDPTTDPDVIYQVVFEGGYYYNVGNIIDPKTGKSEGTTLLRGKYKIQDGNNLKVRFTKLNRLDSFPPEGLSYTDLPELSENGTLEGERRALPSIFVRLFFGGGVLNEVYTDEDMRITYGNSKQADAPFLYVLVRVP